MWRAQVKSKEGNGKPHVITNLKYEYVNGGSCEQNDRHEIFLWKALQTERSPADSWPKDNVKAIVWYTLALVTVGRRENFSLLVDDIKHREEKYVVSMFTICQSIIRNQVRLETWKR